MLSASSQSVPLVMETQFSTSPGSVHDGDMLSSLGFDV